MERCILVPYEFSNEARFALDHAYEIAKTSGLPIHLLYVASSEKDIDEWKIELEAVAKEFVERHNYNKIVVVVKSGNAFDVIYEYGIEQNAYLAVMGVHGIKTIDKQMKLIQKFVKVPFILVQKPLAFGEYDKICIPIDEDKKSRAKFVWVRYLSLLFESKIYISYPEYSDAEKRKNVNNNLSFATTILADNTIDFELVGLPEENFSENLYDYMRTVSPDLVLFMSERYKKTILSIERPRNIELSKNIPVMCVNPRTDIVKLGGFSY